MQLTYVADMKRRSECNVQAARVLLDIVSAKDCITKYQIMIARITRGKPLSLRTNSRRNIDIILLEVMPLIKILFCILIRMRNEFLNTLLS